MKKSWNIKIFVVKLFLVLLIAFFAQLNGAEASSQATVDTEKVLVFLKEVVQLDTSKYEAVLSRKAEVSRPGFDGFVQTTGQYRLDSIRLGGKSIIEVTFTFWDDELISCSIKDATRGKPYYYVEQPHSDLRENALGLLERYETKNGNGQLGQMRDLLNAVDVYGNSSKTSNGMMLDVKTENIRTFLVWSNIANNAGYSRLHFELQNGQFSRWADDRMFYSLGSSEVNLSEEQAIDIALDYVKSFTYTSSGKVVGNFSVVKEEIRSESSALKRTEWQKQYPCWIVSLPLDHMYPGGVSLIKVIVWADTGGVRECIPLGYDAPSDKPYSPPSLTQETSQKEDEGSNNASDKSSDIYAQKSALIIGGSIVALIVFIAAVFKNKMHSVQDSLGLPLPDFACPIIRHVSCEFA